MSEQLRAGDGAPSTGDPIEPNSAVPISGGLSPRGLPHSEPPHDGLPPTSLTPAEPVELEWRRLHPLSPLLRGGLFLLVLVGIVIANLRDRLLELFFAREFVDTMGPNEGDLIDFLVGERLLVWALVAVLAAIAAIVGFSWLSWRFSTFRITSEAVESRRGVLFRQHRRAPLERIQSVNLQRSLLARLLGLTQVDVQTAGQGGKVALQYLGHRDAKRVREQILLAVGANRARIGAGTVSAAGVVGPADVSKTVPGAAARPGHDSSSRPGETSLTVDFSGVAYSETPGLIDERLRDLTDFDIDPGVWETGMLTKVPLGRLIGSILLSSETMIVVLIAIAIGVSSIWLPSYVLASALPLALVLIGMLFSQFNKGFNFVLSRAADGVRIGAGLTATTTETIPFGRVHAVEAMQPLGWRPFGWWRVRITTAGHSVSQAGQNKLQNTVLPVGELDDVLRVFETLLHNGEPGAEDRATALQQALMGPGDGFLRAGPRARIVLWFGARRAGLRVEDLVGEHSSLRIRRGWLTRSLAVMPMLRAQSVQLSRPPVHRVLGLATLQVHTVLGPVRMQMRGIALDEAREAFDLLSGTVVRVQGAEAASRAKVVGGVESEGGAKASSRAEATEGTEADPR